MDRFAGHIVILSGSPGSGKTTTAETMARLPGRTPKVHLHSDDFWGYIKHGHIDPWLPEAADQNRMIMEIAAAVAARYAAAGYLVALDGVIGPWSLPPYLGLGVPTHYLVLRPEADEAVARCLARGGDSLTDPVVVADLHRQFADLGEHARHLLPTAGLDRPQVLAAVIAAVESDRYRLA
jgi:DNA polymerase III delta prime subunit